MHISSVRIENFRSIRDCSLALEPLTALVGYNNAGKSNIMRAIAWALSPTKLDEDDFFNPDERVLVEFELTSVSDEILAGIYEGHADRVQAFVVSGCIRMRRSIARGDSASKASLDLWDHSCEEWKVNPTGLPAALKDLFPEVIEVPAMVDASEEVEKNKSTSILGKLLKQVVEPTLGENETRIGEILGELEGLLGRDGANRIGKLGDVEDAVSSILRETFPDVVIKLDIGVPSHSDLLRAGTLRIEEDGRDGVRPISSLGHGAQRNIHIALIRYLAEHASDNGDPSARRILLIEEPELYLHPQAIEATRSALERLSEADYQVVYCTHSAHMVTRKNVVSAALVTKSRESGTLVRKSLRSVTEEQIESAMERSRTLLSLANTAGILFSDRVVLVEGATEELIVPALFECLTGATLALRRGAIVRLDGVGSLGNSRMVLNHLGMPHKCVVDLDFAFREAPRSGELVGGRSEFARAREICARLESDGHLTLADDGFPKKGVHGSAADGFARFAQEQDAIEDVINPLHQALRSQGIWVWTRGTIERHLGTSGRPKGEGTWSDLVARLEDSSTIHEVVADPQSIEDFVAWLDTP